MTTSVLEKIGTSEHDDKIHDGLGIIFIFGESLFEDLEDVLHFYFAVEQFVNGEFRGAEAIISQGSGVLENPAGFAIIDLLGQFDVHSGSWERGGILRCRTGSKRQVVQGVLSH